MQTVTAKSASFARRSKDSVGAYPFYVPRASIDATTTPRVVRRRNGEKKVVKQ